MVPYNISTLFLVFAVPGELKTIKPEVLNDGTSGLIQTN